jgi:hypothetical protein
MIIKSLLHSRNVISLAAVGAVDRKAALSVMFWRSCIGKGRTRRGVGSSRRQARMTLVRRKSLSFRPGGFLGSGYPANWKVQATLLVRLRSRPRECAARPGFLSASDLAETRWQRRPPYVSGSTDVSVGMWSLELRSRFFRT